MSLSSPESGSLEAAKAAFSTIPNFLYIGTSKAGSTWIYNLLSHHAEVILAASKGLYFYDGHFDRGWEWYLKHFASAGDATVVGEISHSYLYSTDACERIQQANSDMKLMVCLREPVARSFSAYLDGVKNGQLDCDFETALEQDSSLIDRGCYATHLRPYVDRFGFANIHVGVFDEIADAPQEFSDKLFQFLGIDALELDEKLTKKMMPAAKPRSKLLVRVAKSASRFIRNIGLKRVKGWVKRQRVVRDLLYRKFTNKDKPMMSGETRAMLHERFRPEIVELDEMLNTNFVERWGYSE